MQAQGKIVGAGLALMLLGCEPTGGVEDNRDQEGQDHEASGSCKVIDDWEPNPHPDQANTVAWQEITQYSAVSFLNPYLCKGEDDWYRFEVESLNYPVHQLRVRALIKDAGLCGEPCDQPVLPAGPQHAMTIQVYRADTMALLTSNTGNDGVLGTGGTGEAFSHDLLIRVSSPTKAKYPYRMSVSMQAYDGEDECEC